jgi:cbb3-type cytochrome oxidase subunit 3
MQVSLRKGREGLHLMGAIMEFLRAWWVVVVPVGFILVLAYALNPRRKKEFQDDANIPFDDK